MKKSKRRSGPIIACRGGGVPIAVAPFIAWVAVTMTPSLRSETCEGNVILRSQSEIDAFSCEYVGGDLTITDDNDGMDDITNLDGLRNLVSVRLNLIFEDNDSLEDLHGLSKLQGVGKNLMFTGNDSLPNLDGLMGMEDISQNLIILDNPALTNIDGLGNLTSVGVSIVIKRNASLTNINGLGRITPRDWIGGTALMSLTILGNRMLDSYCGLYGIVLAEGIVGLTRGGNLWDPINLENTVFAGGPCQSEIDLELTISVRPDEGIVLDFPVIQGWNYTVYYREVLGDDAAGWQPLDRAPHDSGRVVDKAAFNEMRGAHSRFYRLGARKVRS